MTAKEIESHIDAGRDLHIVTYLKHIRINKKTLDKFRAANYPLFKDGKGGFYIAAGRRYDFVLLSGCNVYFD